MPYPGGRKQLTAIFLSIQRKKGTAAAKRFYKKAQSEGYAPTEKKDRKRKHDHRAEAIRKHRG